MGFIFEIMFPLVFILVFGIVIYGIIQGISQWNKNNNSPKLNVNAKVVSKRTNVSRHNHSTTGNMHHTHTSTYYYVTFEFDSGDRIELRMSGSGYGMLIEGDKGVLFFQGTRYLGCNRKF